MPAVETDVLVVGSGPGAAAAALFLATYRTPAMVITRYGHLSDTPRAHITNQPGPRSGSTPSTCRTSTTVQAPLTVQARSARAFSAASSSSRMAPTAAASAPGGTGSVMITTLPPPGLGMTRR